MNALELAQTGDLTHTWVGYLVLFIFFVAYVLVVFEEKIHLRKSKPVLAAASLIWIIIAYVYHQRGDAELVEHAIERTFIEYTELFFFLLVAMTYINAMLERGVFSQLRLWLVSKGFSYRQLFWLTGFLAFFISPVADNLTTALIMCSVVMAVGSEKPQFISLSCLNIVVAANSGGAFSPFGDITTLMVWQKEILSFWEFFALFIPALVHFVVLAFAMQFFISTDKPPVVTNQERLLKPGGVAVVFLFMLTIVTAVTFHQLLEIPPVFGMLTGLAYLKFFSYYAYLKSHRQATYDDLSSNLVGMPTPDTVFEHVSKAEWDTLFFFYGVIMAVGGLGFLGYLELTSNFLYGEYSATTANIFVGVLSAVIDNIPVMFAVLTMEPDMSDYQWLLVTFTVGVGGSLLSIGSAAGVALMGQARGYYTFLGHLKWTPMIALSVAAGIYAHYLISG